MLTFNLKKQWFDKIKSGEKTHEYREVKPYWTKRFYNLSSGMFFDVSNDCFCNVALEFTNNLQITCKFVCGYPSQNDKDKILYANIKRISIIDGKNTDLAVDKDVYDIEFELVSEQD